MSGLIKRVAEAKAACAKLDWELELAGDSNNPHLFRITVPAPYDMRVIMNIDSAERGRATIDEIETVLEDLQRKIGRAVESHACMFCDEPAEPALFAANGLDVPSSCLRYMSEEYSARFSAVQEQLVRDLEAQTVEEVLPARRY